MYESILLPTDGSDAAVDAAEHACRLAECEDATLHVLSVVERGESAAIVGQGVEKLETLREHGSDATRKIVELAQSREIDAVGAVEVGTPARTILEYADDHDVDVVVMSTHARSGVGRFLHGSVTEEVMREGSVPVFAVQR